MIALKKTQLVLFENAALYFEHFESEMASLKRSEKDHGRIERWECCLLKDLLWLPEADNQAGTCAIGRIKAAVMREGQTMTEVRYHLTSVKDVDKFADVVRKEALDHRNSTALVP